MYIYICIYIYVYVYVYHCVACLDMSSYIFYMNQDTFYMN